MVTSLGGMGVLIATLLLLVRKGPIAGLMILLGLSVLVLIVSILSALVKRGPHG